MVHISSSWVETRLNTEFQLPRLPGSRTASFWLNHILKLEASLAPAEDEVGAVAKADQKSHRVLMILKYQTIKCCDMMVTKPR